MGENALFMSRVTLFIHARLVRSDRKAQITTYNNRRMQKSISECSTCRTLKQLGYSRFHQNWTLEDWKNVAWSFKSWFLLQNSYGRVRIWCKQHGNMDPSCLVSTVQAAGYVMMWGIFYWHTLGPLVPNKHCLNGTTYLGIVVDHVHPFITTVYPFSNGYFQQNNVPRHKAQLISNNELSVLMVYSRQVSTQ